MRNEYGNPEDANMIADRKKQRRGPNKTASVSEIPTHIGGFVRASKDGAGGMDRNRRELSANTGDYRRTLGA